MARRKRPLLILAAVAALIAAVVFGWLHWIGYYGGPVYALYPATGEASPAQRGTVAVILSGDMGLKHGMASKISAGLAGHGIPVLAINSLTFFRHHRSPAEAGALVADAARRMLALPGAQRVVLIGQSFGADALQVGVGRLPPNIRAKVAKVILVVPGDTVLLKASPGGLLDGAPDGPALPTARQIDWVPVTCIHGETEANSLCPIWHQPNVTTLTLPGDHYLQHDVERVTQVIWDAISSAGKDNR